jgi:hypothetical protein
MVKNLERNFFGMAKLHCKKRFAIFWPNIILKILREKLSRPGFICLKFIIFVLVVMPIIIGNIKIFSETI